MQELPYYTSNLALVPACTWYDDLSRSVNSIKKKEEVLQKENNSNKKIQTAVTWSITVDRDSNNKEVSEA